MVGLCLDGHIYDLHHSLQFLFFFCRELCKKKLEADTKQREAIWLGIYMETIHELSEMGKHLAKKNNKTRKVRNAGILATAGGLALTTVGGSMFVAGSGAATTAAGVVTLGSSIAGNYRNNNQKEKDVLELLEIDRQLTTQAATSGNEASSDRTTSIEITKHGGRLSKLTRTGTISTLQHYLSEIQHEMERRFRSHTMRDEDDWAVVSMMMTQTSLY